MHSYPYKNFLEILRAIDLLLSTVWGYVVSTSWHLICPLYNLCGSVLDTMLVCEYEALANIGGTTTSQALISLVFNAGSAEQSPPLQRQLVSTEPSSQSSISSLAIILSEGTPLITPSPPTPPPDIGSDQQDFESMGGGLVEETHDGE